MIILSTLLYCCIYILLVKVILTDHFTALFKTIFNLELRYFSLTSSSDVRFLTYFSTQICTVCFVVVRSMIHILLFGFIDLSPVRYIILFSIVVERRTAFLFMAILLFFNSEPITIMACVVDFFIPTLVEDMKTLSRIHKLVVVGDTPALYMVTWIIATINKYKRSFPATGIILNAILLSLFLFNLPKVPTVQDFMIIGWMSISISSYIC